MADLGDAKREACRLKYRDYKNVPWQDCVYCSEKSRCGKPKPGGVVEDGDKKAFTVHNV